MNGLLEIAGNYLFKLLNRCQKVWKILQYPKIGQYEF
jgi:hypothetical protein